MSGIQTIQTPVGSDCTVKTLVRHKVTGDIFLRVGSMSDEICVLRLDDSDLMANRLWHWKKDFEPVRKED